MSYRPALALSSILLVPTLATAQTGERYREEARHRFETEQGVGVYQPPNPGCFDPDHELDPTSCDDVFGSPVYYVSQHAARARVFHDATLDHSGVLAIDLDLAWRVGVVDEIGKFGPLLLGAQVAWIAAAFVARGGLGIGVPVHEVLSDGTSFAETPLLVAPYGSGEAWLGRPDVPIVLQLSLEARHEWLFGGVDAGGALLAMRDRYVGQLGAFIGVRPITLFAFGVRALVVSEQSEWGWGSRSDKESVSITTFARLDTRPLFAELRWLVNVDEPYGVGFGGGAFWSLRALIGWETE